jgi:hypothetical protein
MATTASRSAGVAHRTTGSLIAPAWQAPCAAIRAAGAATARSIDLAAEPVDTAPDRRERGPVPIDGGLVVGYLTAALLRAGQRWGDKTLDSLLNRLTDLVVRRMGNKPVDRLSKNPSDPNVQREVGLTIDGAVSVDAAFASELTKLVKALDERGGRQIINTVYATTNVQAFDHGVAVGRDFNYFSVPDPSDISDAPGWVKFCVGLGAALAVAGLFIFGYTLFTDMPDLDDPDFGEVPPGIPIAFGVFFAGFVVLGIGAMGRAMSRRP